LFSGGRNRRSRIAVGTAGGNRLAVFVKIFRPRFPVLGGKPVKTGNELFVRKRVSTRKLVRTGLIRGLVHIFRRPDQLKNEFLKVMDIIFIIFNALEFENFEAQISLRDPENKEKYIGSDENWEKAESAIVEACAEKGLKARVELGEAAFYGPKLDFMVKDALGRRWQLGTIQVDYNLPERFELEYTGEDNQKHRPVMIHRAPFGSMERFVAVLIEHTAGKFPLWLTPDQVVVLPISEKFNDYAYEVAKTLNNVDVRVQVDDRNEKIGRKIRDNELKRIPYMLIVGEKEAENGEVAVRRQGEGDKGTMSVADFAKLVTDEVDALVSKY
jgi:threonyl-tRNA synthetase